MEIGSMEIGSVISSIQHCHYIGKILIESDSKQSPSPNDYGLGRFIKVRLQEETEAYGVVFNTVLLNPAYYLRIRTILSQQELNILSPDYADDTEILIHILLVGSKKNETFSQDISELVIPHYSKILKASDEEIKKLHHPPGNGSLQLLYLEKLLALSGRNFKDVLGEIIRKLKSLSFSEEENKKLNLLFRTFSFQNLFFLNNHYR